MRNMNRHKSSDKQSIMTEHSFTLTILLIVGITVTVGTMVLTVFFNLSLPACRLKLPCLPYSFPTVSFR